jgi:phosphoglycerate dehydrogenase-like enzyme
LTETRSARVAVGPEAAVWVSDAVAAGGGETTALSDEPNALVWADFGSRHLGVLKEIVEAHPGIEWVQLPLAGVERILAAGIFDRTRVFTSAKGLYSEPVAEHALALALACLRELPERARATSWGRPAATTIYDQPVTIVGGGGIASALIRLLQPFRVETTVVRRRPQSLPGAHRTVVDDGLFEALSGALVVVLALAATPTTNHLIDTKALSTMRSDSVLVNIARGVIVDTEALVTALQNHSIGWAALDVTDPEPLPDGHPLWTSPNCLITPHTADTVAMNEPLLAARITANVAHFRLGTPLEGVVDLDLGY